MKKFIITLITVFILGSFYSCDFLDVVPDETPTEEDAFKDVPALERYMYSCYSFIPNPRSGDKSLDLLTSDEVVTSFEHEDFAKFPKGDYSPDTPVISYWNTLFQGIRQCYLLLDNIDRVPNVSDDMKQAYTSEATFLIAYYHFLLLRSYGPVMIISSTPDINMSPDDYPGRSTYDECVNWIADKFDESINMGIKDTHSGSDYGRATSVAAKALKSRMLLYAASPLFNGGKSSLSGTDDVSGAYAAFKDKEGVQLISTTYDASKWQRAADAALEAINWAEGRGAKLYDDGKATTAFPYPDDPVQRKLRMTIMDKQSPELLWVDTRKEGGFGLQNKSAPYGKNDSWNGVAPTITMLEAFYTKNGLPINEDPAFDYANRYGYSNQSSGAGTTLNLNQNREPRFEAWISYHNSNYEYNRDGKFLILTRFRSPDNCGKQGRNSNFSPTGYLTKKGQPES